MSKRRKFLRFSLGSMLLCFTLFAIVLGFWSNGAWHQKVAVTALERAGANVEYETHPLEMHEEQRQQLQQLPKIFQTGYAIAPPPKTTAAEKRQLWRRKHVRKYLGKHFVDKLVALHFGRHKLRDRPTIMEWASIQSIDSIRTATVGPYANDKDLANICRITGIEHLSISSAMITGDDLQQVARMNELVTLEIVPFPADTRIADLDLPPKLESLHLDYVVVLDDNDVATLAKRDQPPSISGAKFNVSDRGLRHLAKLQFGDELSLRHNHRITDAGMKWIGQMNAAKFDLEGAKITDSGLRHLEDLPNLKFLNLVGTDVSLEGVGRLKQRFPASVIWHSNGHPK